MKKIKILIFPFIFSIHSKIYASDAWILWWTTVEKLREWNIWLDDIPWMLQFAINWLMWFAWTIAVIFIIIWAYKLALWSLENDKSKWKETIILAIWGFILAALSWVILKVIIDNFT